MERRKLIIRRWRDLALLTITAIIIAAYLQNTVITKLSDWFYIVVNDWMVVPALLLLSIIPVSIFGILWHLGGFRFKDFDLGCSSGNPPTWYAALLSVSLYPVISYSFDGDMFDVHDIYWIPIVCCIPLILGTLSGVLFPCKTIQHQPFPANPSRDRLKELSDDPEKLIKWLEKEEPIKTYSEDYFDATPIADRIANSLLKIPPETIAFIGNYGSGKTSVLNLAKLKLEQNGMLVLSLSAWAFEDGKFANYVISLIIQRIAKETDCISASLLPFRFQNTFHQLDFGIFNFVKFFVHTESPDDLVKKINDILLRSDDRIVVFIEDIDRNNSPSLDQELYSLFNYFSVQNNISFVITHGGIV